MAAVARARAVTMLRNMVAGRDVLVDEEGQLLGSKQAGTRDA